MHLFNMTNLNGGIYDILLQRAPRLSGLKEYFSVVKHARDNKSPEKAFVLLQTFKLSSPDNAKNQFFCPADHWHDDINNQLWSYSCCTKVVDGQAISGVLQKVQ